MVSPGTSAGREFRQGWPLILTAFLGTGVAASTFYTMGIFVQPLHEAFGWGRGFISSGLTIYSVFSVILSGFAGRLIDKAGPRRVALPGLVAYCVLVAALALNNGSIVIWATIWILLAVAGTMITPTVWSTAVIGRFQAGRGLALAIALTGGGLSAFWGPVLCGWLINNYGWRIAYVGIAAICLIVVFPLTYLCFFGADDLHRRNGTVMAVADRPTTDIPLSVAMRSAPFLKLCAACFLIVLTNIGITVHVIPLLMGAGIGRGEAAGIGSIIGLTAVVGRLTTGSLLDRTDARMIGTIVALLPIVAFSCLLGIKSSLALGYISAVVLGLGAGAEIEMSAFLSSRFFPRPYFATMFGVIIGLISLGAGVGPAIAGFVFDATGSYQWALIAAIPTITVAALLVFSLGPCPPDKKGASAVPAH